ncbi:MAG: HAMP domain-containing histidine kinase [Pirellulales bacterium]|nr:HAMP domain-containing histidine kinase [Pirellulales bacterium]
MHRPWQIWLALAIVATLGVAAMARLTREAIRADLARTEATRREELAQRISLALWRMDTKLAPLVAEEIARPAEAFSSFTGGSTSDGTQPNGVATPSPLLAGSQAQVMLNFTCSPASGAWTSPQVPEDQWGELAAFNGLAPNEQHRNRELLAELSQRVDPRLLLDELPVQQLPQSRRSSSLRSTEHAGSSESSREDAGGIPFYGNYSALEGAAEINESSPSRRSGVETSSASGAKGQAAPVQQPSTFNRAANDLQHRSNRYQAIAQQEFVKQRGGAETLERAARMPQIALQGRLPVATVESVSRPLWIGGELLLARRVERNGEVLVQGSWLDWPAIRDDLLGEVRDLLPSAQLVPATNLADADPSRLLAGLPVMLEPREKMLVLEISPAMTWALSIGWGALAVALAAVTVLLAGVLALSERRAAFVSAVTHELRTPLTTFRMYAEMLAGDMVPSDQRRREYLATLKTEAERLTRLVENVLSYARLERGRGPRRTDRTTLGELVDRFAPRLRERAEQAGMELTLELDDAAAETKLLTDAGVCEQIIFNLVDNAAKYAARATDRRILLHAKVAADTAILSVRDFGPGFSPAALARGSRPFRKSAQEAAESAPGVGLGLSLCKRLAGELGGRLEVASDAGGTTATLALPREKKSFPGSCDRLATRVRLE